MDKRRIWLLGSLLICIAAIILLVTGSSLLTTPLDKNNTIPLGTFITWAGLISLPLSIYWGIKKLRKPESRLYSYLSLILKATGILAVLWVPNCYLLAGNISYTFAEKEIFQGGQLAMKWFWGFTYSIVIVPILILIIHLVYSTIKKI